MASTGRCVTASVSRSLTRVVRQSCDPGPVATPCALGFVAKTGKAVAVAIGPGPELLGKWGLVLVPPGQERFVYHAAVQLDGDAGPWVRASTAAIANEAQRADRRAARFDHDTRGCGSHRRARTRTRSPALRDPRRAVRDCTPPKVCCTAASSSTRLDTHGIDTTLVPPEQLHDRDDALARFGKVPSPWRREHKDAAVAAIDVLRPDRASGRGSEPRNSERNASTSAGVSGRNSVSRAGRHHTASSHSQCSWRSTRFNTFCVAVDGSPSVTRTKRGIHLGDRSDCASRNATNAVGIERRPVAQVQRDHHLVADVDRRHRVDRGEHDVGMAGEHQLDRRGREVLAVDAQPVASAAGEVEEAVLVAVAEVAGPVHAVAHALGVGFGVVVVALEAAARRRGSRSRRSPPRR